MSKYEFAVRNYKIYFLRQALEANKFNQCKTAKDLGIHRNTLNRAIHDLGMVVPGCHPGRKP